YVHRPDSHKPGGNGARNYGFELSIGEYINWFDDDDVMLSDFIKRRVQSFTENMKVSFCSYAYAGENLENKRSVTLIETPYLYKDYALWKFQVLTPSALFKKEFLLGKELFSYEIIRGQETELFLRLFLELAPKNYKIINESLFLYR